MGFGRYERAVRRAEAAFYIPATCTLDSPNVHGTGVTDVSDVRTPVGRPKRRRLPKQPKPHPNMKPTTLRGIINDPIFLQRGLGVVLWSALILVLITNSSM